MYHQFNIQQFHVLPIQCIYVFCVDLRTNSDYFPIQHYLTGFYNWDGVCLLRGTNWAFKCCSQCIVHSPTNALFIKTWKSLNLHENTHNHRSYMFRSSTILRELVQSMAKVTFLLKHSVKLRHCIFCEDVAARREMACVLFVVHDKQHIRHYRFHNSLPTVSILNQINTVHALLS